MTTILDVQDIRVHYGILEAVKGVSFFVDEGMIVSLMGANGAGKTTILKSISGFKPPTSGTIVFAGQGINDLAPRNIVALGIAQVPEGRRVFPYMSVEENLLVGSHLRGKQVQIAGDLEEIFKRFPILRDRKKQQAGSLSGGEQQMLVIGRALMARPRLLLLDEPSLGLSPIIVQEIARMIYEIKRQGVSILLVEQNARMALRLSKKAYILETGHIVLEGESGELLENDFVKKAYLGG